MDAARTDLTFVVNLHKEGALCRASLESAERAVAHARRAGLTAELLLTLDRADALTERAVATAQCDARILPVDVGDLSLSRNCAVAAAHGRHIGFMDGDDLCCEEWLARAVAEVGGCTNDCIVHPRINLFFGRNYNNYFWIHPDMRLEEVTLRRLLVENLWTAPVLARRHMFEKFPYRPNRLSSGYGYEDWVWNLETSAAGILHVAAADTVFFIRRNKRGSLMEESVSANVLPDLRSILGGGALASVQLDRLLGRSGTRDDAPVRLASPPWHAAQGNP